MKKLLLFAAILGTSASMANAQETVVNLFSGSQQVTWSNTMSFEASVFENVKVGNYIYATYADGKSGFEFKSNGEWVPGSYFINSENNFQAKYYITEEGLSVLQQYGLEICGEFLLESLSIMDDGFVMPEGAIWGGYFWVDNWNTLEIWKTAFANYNGQRYLDVYLAPDNTNDVYFMKVLTNWNPETVVANNENIVKTSNIATIDLQGVNLTEMLAADGVNALMIQANPEGGNAFNMISVVLRDDENSGNSSVVNSFINENTGYDVFTLQGLKVKSGADFSGALNNLPKGVYIVRGANKTMKVVK